MKTNEQKWEQVLDMEMLLDEFVRARGYVPAEAMPLLESDELPLCLRQHTERLCADTRWRAWATHTRLWFVTGQYVDAFRTDPQEAAVKVTFYDANGSAAACAVWLRRAGGAWLLKGVLEPEQAGCDAEPSRNTRLARILRTARG